MVLSWEVLQSLDSGLFFVLDGILAMVEAWREEQLVNSMKGKQWRG